MIREPNTVPIPAPDPATPTMRIFLTKNLNLKNIFKVFFRNYSVAAPAPINLAAVSISLLTGVEAMVLEARAILRAGDLAMS